MDAAPLTPEQMGQTSPTNFPKLIAQGLGSMHNLDMPGAKAPMLWTVSRSLIDGNAPSLCVSWSDQRPTLYCPRLQQFLDKWYKMACDVTFPAGSAKAESLAKLGLPKVGETVCGQ